MRKKMKLLVAFGLSLVLLATSSQVIFASEVTKPIVAVAEAPADTNATVSTNGGAATPAPAGTEGTVEAKTISKVDISGIVTPVVGDTPEFKDVVFGDGSDSVKIDYQGWAEIPDSEETQASEIRTRTNDDATNKKAEAEGVLLGTFENGKKYLYIISLTAESGATFDENTKVTFDGVNTLGTENNGNTLIAYKEYDPVEMKTIDITVTEPVEGENPEFNLDFKIPDNILFGTTAWTRLNADNSKDKLITDASNINEELEKHGKNLTEFSADGSYEFSVYFYVGTPEKFHPTFDNLRVRFNGEIVELKKDEANGVVSASKIYLPKAKPVVVTPDEEKPGEVVKQMEETPTPEVPTTDPTGKETKEDVTSKDQTTELDQKKEADVKTQNTVSPKKVDAQKADNKNGQLPQTGDFSAVAMWTTFAGLGFFGTGSLLMLKRKKI